MALTPEDVLNKNFTATQFRRGYDEQEVDDFLDEVVAELRRLTQERDDLATQLAECRKGKGAGRRRPRRAPPPPRADRHGKVLRGMPARRRQPSRRRARGGRSASRPRGPRPSRPRRTRPSASPGPATPRPGPRPSRPTGCAPTAGAAGAAVRRSRGRGRGADAAGLGGAAGAAGVIALAQKLHDEHVAEGQSTRDRLDHRGPGAPRPGGRGGPDQARRARRQRPAPPRRAPGDRAEAPRELVDTAQKRHDELIAEATTRHDTMIREARDQSTGMVGQAQQQKQAILGELGQRARPAAEEDRRAALVRAQLPGPAEVLPRVPAARPRVGRRRPGRTARGRRRVQAPHGRAERRPGGLRPPRSATQGADPDPVGALRAPVAGGAGTTARRRARRAPASAPVRRSGRGRAASPTRAGGARAGRTTYVVPPLSRAADGSILATCPRFRG